MVPRQHDVRGQVPEPRVLRSVVLEHRPERTSGGHIQALLRPPHYVLKLAEKEHFYTHTRIVADGPLNRLVARC